MAREIKNIIVHHSLSRWGDGEVVKSWHMDAKPGGNGWNAPGYHVVICNGFPTYSAHSAQKPVKSADGRADRIWPESNLSNGCKYANRNALQVCMIGDFDTDCPTLPQVERLTGLLAYWCKKYGLDPENDIYGHGEMQLKIGREGYSKSCPGKLLDMDAIRCAVRDSLNG